VGATIDELKEIIVDLKVSLAKANVPQGNCPYAYYNINKNNRPNCNDVSCKYCTIDFWTEYKKDKILEVDEL
jgi:hypothetical protein